MRDNAGAEKNDAKGPKKPLYPNYIKTIYRLIALNWGKISPIALKLE